MTSLALAFSIAFAAPSPKDVPACPSASDAPDVAQLVARTQQLLQGKSMIATMTMSIQTPSYARSLKMKIWSKGEAYALVRILEGGPRETGMMTLKRDKQLWNYLPQAGRVMKLPSGMLGDSWMGSDFTNDDLVHGASLTKDFDAKVNAADKKTWSISLIPAKNAVVVWGKIDMTVDRASCLPVEEKFYDENGKVARTMTFADFKRVGWRDFPTKMTVKPAENGRETSIAYDDLQFDVDVPDDTFSVHRLEQGR